MGKVPVQGQNFDRS